MDVPGRDLDVRLDDRLPDLARMVVERIGFDPPEAKARLRPPRLTVVKGPPILLNAFTLSTPDGGKVILMGGGLYDFLHHYTQAAATYFLPSRPGGRRPSEAWPASRKAMATTLDWISSPAAVPSRFGGAALSPTQAQAASAFAAYAYRFALCHELAHVALDDLDISATAELAGHPDRVTILRSRQDEEIQADRLGLELQMRSLPDEGQTINGLAGAMYFTEAMSLLKIRLMLLSELVDELRWDLRYTHPPSMQRSFALAQAAHVLVGEAASAGMLSLQGQLGGLNGEFTHAASINQDRVIGRAAQLIDAEIEAGLAMLDPADTSRRRVAARLDPWLDRRRSALTSKVLRLFDESPLGVMKALVRIANGDPSSRRSRAEVSSAITWTILDALPPSFQQFARHSRAERVSDILGVRAAADRPIEA